MTTLIILMIVMIVSFLVNIVVIYTRDKKITYREETINSLIVFAPNAIFIQGNLELYEWCEHEIWHRESATEIELRICLDVLDQVDINTLESQIRNNTEEEFEIDDVNYVIIYK